MVFFVHGAMDRGSSWDKVRRRLPEYETVAFDRRGYAESAGLSFSADPFADHVEDLTQLISQFAAQKAVVLVGHSAGSNIVLAAAERLPNVVGAVVFEPPMPWTDWWPSSAGGSTLSVYAAEGPEAAAESFMRRIVGDSIWERLPSATRDARRREGLALVADLSTLRGRPVQFDHGVVQIPVVVGCGELSLPHHREGARRTADQLPAGALVELAGQRHGAHSSDPVGFVGLIHRVLAASS
jgi:pimeloyl-ACP methyl ester carboxylesterase